MEGKKAIAVLLGSILSSSHHTMLFWLPTIQSSTTGRISSRCSPFNRAFGLPAILAADLLAVCFCLEPYIPYSACLISESTQQCLFTIDSHLHVEFLIVCHTRKERDILVGKKKKKFKAVAKTPG